ncbi:MAG: hypothetical protein ACPGNT_01665 [Rhodospirillales bacterium]
MSSENTPFVPPAIELNQKTKGVVIGGIKKVLERLRADDLMANGPPYGEVIADPGLLFDFIRAYKEFRGVGKDLAVDAKGRPVMDDTTPLICGMTLGQIERLLVFTAAKKVFAEKGKALHPNFRESIAFAWQLPLLELYAERVDPLHLGVLGPVFFSLSTAGHLAALDGVNPTQLKRLKGFAGDDFPTVLQTHPAAGRGLAAVDDAGVSRVRKFCGEAFWDFFDRDPQTVLEVLDIRDEVLKGLGPSAAHVCLPTLRTLERMPISILPIFMEGFQARMGGHGRDLLGDATFDRDFLRELVERFESLGKRDQTEDVREKVAMAVQLKWQAIEPKLMEWLDSRYA